MKILVSYVIAHLEFGAVYSGPSETLPLPSAGQAQLWDEPEVVFEQMITLGLEPYDAITRFLYIDNLLPTTMTAAELETMRCLSFGRMAKAGLRADVTAYDPGSAGWFITSDLGIFDSACDAGDLEGIWNAMYSIPNSDKELFQPVIDDWMNRADLAVNRMVV